MRKLFMLGMFLALAVAVSAGSKKKVYISTSFHEPANEGLRFIYSHDGLHWDSIPGTWLKPEVGNQKVMRDPSIQQTPDGTVHLVWTSSWRGDRGFGYASSKDLIHWTEERFIEVMKDTTTVNVWAPELFWDDTRQEMMIIWASCIPGKFERGIEEEKNNHRLYYVTTKDFKKFSEAKLLIDPGYSSIDATLVKRGKKDYVMVVKDNTRPMRNIKISFAKDPHGPWSATSKPFTPEFCEGPTTCQLADGSYMVYCDRYRLFDFGGYNTKDFVTFKDITSQTSIPKGHKHGTIFMADEEIVYNLLHYKDRVHYTGTELSNPNHHDGQLSPAVGVHNIQIMRANREHPSEANGYGWTYNHQPMMAYWKGKFYVHYLCDPKDEQVPPSHTLLQVSNDGYNWGNPVMLFPEYNVPDGFTKKGVEGVAKDMKAVMHQRQGFYVSSENRLYAMGSYGVCLSPKDHNNDGNGIGRVIREVFEDGSLGKIYFMYYNHDFNEKNTDYPNYKKADKHLRKAVEEIYANPRIRMQWVEEADRGDKIIPLNKDYKAYNDYTLPDGRLVSLWKHALTSISTDGGNTWSEPIGRAKGFVNSNAKIWGQRLSDGTYATVYNPSEFRWPLAISLSKDGLEYTTLNLVNGEVPPMRYGGNYKSFGPQYVRGILEGNGTPEDGDMWLSYSMNKEDMWVCHIPVPVQTEATAHANDDFATKTKLADLREWNIYSPVEAPVSLDGKWLVLSDKDKFDYCRVERKIPATKRLAVEFDIEAAQNDHGWLQIEFLDKDGTAASRLELTDGGEMRCKGGARYGKCISYEKGKTYHVRAEIDVTTRMATTFVDGKKVQTRVLFAPAESIERVMFRTGVQRTYPTVDTPADWYGTLENAGEQDQMAQFKIANFKTCALPGEAQGAVLNYKDFKHYVDRFNTMEDENIVQAIPNSKAWDWMQENVPLFECSDPMMEEMYWFRWWSVRKHIEETPVGYAMTEFLVERNYADKWKLISSGVGHHIHESRWMRNPLYLDQIMNTWYKGNGGQPMAKLNAYSSWIPYSLWQRYLVDGRKDWIVEQLPSIEWEIADWQKWHQFSETMPFPVGKAGYGRINKKNDKGIKGMYWQTDVRDAMEETISGDRRKQQMRPSINAYMWGNNMAAANIARLSGDEKKAEGYAKEAENLRSLILNNLWSDKLQFFGTHSGDSILDVREAIGFMPWYVGMPVEKKNNAAWQQIADEQGFNAPYGLTTAERRHPKFRTHGVGKCEWDGAIWPFATSQTLTGLINYANTADADADWCKDNFFAQMKKYTEAQHKRGIPYIGEYQDEVTGYWLKGDQERSRYYNHSTYCDLVITGICGLTPREDNTVEVNPLFPEGKLTYFCLDDVLYHGHNLTIVYDADGQRYHHGKGITIYVDGVKKASADKLGKVTCEL